MRSKFELDAPCWRMDDTASILLILSDVQEMSETPMTMMMHGMMAGAVVYIASTTLLNQSSEYAMFTGALTANAVSTYMILFGHSAPF